MCPKMTFVSAKWLLLLGSMAVVGCSVTTSHPRTSKLDHSDAEHYDRPHAPSPDYRGRLEADTSRVPKRVYRLRKSSKRRVIRVEIVPPDEQ